MTYPVGDWGLRARLAGVLGLALALAGCEPEPACDGVATVFAGDARIEERATAVPERLECAEVVTGDLHIHGTALRTLAGLGRLRHVQGDLEISRNEQLESLEGLDRLQRVDGNVEVSFNAELRDLDGLGGLERVGKSLHISRLERLESLAPLELSLGGDLVLTSLDALETLEGLEVASVPGSIEIRSAPRLREVGSLLAGLFLKGSLAIRDNESLTEILALPEMRYFDDAPALPAGSHRADVEACGGGRPAIEIASNDRLERIAVDGREFDGCVAVSNNDALRELRFAFDFIVELESLELDELPSLETFALSESEVTSPLIVRDRLWLRRVGLTDLGTLDRLLEVGCTLYVSENPALDRLLPALRAANHVTITENERLETCELEAWSAALRPILPSDSCSQPAYPDVQIYLSGNGGAACE
jgi:hypothetical protein